MDPSSSSVEVDEVEDVGLVCGVLPPDDWLQTLEARPEVELVAGVTVENVLSHTVEGVDGIGLASSSLNKADRQQIETRIVPRDFVAGGLCAASRLAVS